jgi:predicted DNA-binding transcriptional regulator YafY
MAAAPPPFQNTCIMPLNKDALTRYRLIDERLRNTMLPRPSVNDLIRYISGKMDRSVSRRTVLLDIQHMKESPDLNYMAPIAYDRFRGGYYYEEEGYSINRVPVTEYELQGLEIAVSILKQFQKLPVIRQFEDAIMKIADSVRVNRQQLQQEGLIHLDTPPDYKGLEWVPEIAEAIRTRNIIRIRYQSFERKTPREYRLEPYHLREYNNRFYLFARSLKDAAPGVKTFGLDRILDIWPTYDHFEARDFDETSYFRNAIGITVPEGKPEKIVLSFTPHQGQYVKAQPLHWSQRVLADNAGELRVELDLVVNYELMMLLLSYGSGLKIIAPRSLVERFTREAEAMLARYRNG